MGIYIRSKRGNNYLKQKNLLMFYHALEHKTNMHWSTKQTNKQTNKTEGIFQTISFVFFFLLFCKVMLNHFFFYLYSKVPLPPRKHLFNICLSLYNEYVFVPLAQMSLE